jgi:hypothetical protein
MDMYVTRRLLTTLAVAGTQVVSLRGAIALYEQRYGPFRSRAYVQQVLSEFDEKTTPLHQCLASLPFRLVLSAAPDRMMFNAFVAAGKSEAQEACYNYSRNAAAQSMLTVPTSDTPIVYSVFGRHDHPESMVLNEKNLLDYLMKSVKEAPALPDTVRAKLRAPSTVFLFIGFGLSNWWLRLVLKVLEIIGVENRGLSLALEDNASFGSGQLSEEDRTFFESVGIYIETGANWADLAESLARAAPSSGPLAPRTSLGKSRAPLVFLSYASEDVVRVGELRDALARRGIDVWHDRRNLRGGRSWEQQIKRIVSKVDYFVFIQSPAMDRRDDSRLDGVYNAELNEAIGRLRNRPYGSVFIFHATVGRCKRRLEPQLQGMHRNKIDTDSDIENLINDILCADDAEANAVPSFLAS